jgi:hypothetical protein
MLGRKEYQPGGIVEVPKKVYSHGSAVSEIIKHQFVNFMGLL